MISIVPLLFLYVATVSGLCPTSGPELAAKIFKAYDNDNNGRISRIEGITIFKMSDSNSDGSLSPEEYSSEWAFYNSDSFMPFFRAGDENGDGKIDFLEGNKAFDYFDNDEDGEISSLEFTRTWDFLENWLRTNGFA